MAVDWRQSIHIIELVSRGGRPWSLEYGHRNTKLGQGIYPCYFKQTKHLIIDINFVVNNGWPTAYGVHVWGKDEAHQVCERKVRKRECEGEEEREWISRAWRRGVNGSRGLWPALGSRMDWWESTGSDCPEDGQGINRNLRVPLPPPQLSSLYIQAKGRRPPAQHLPPSSPPLPPTPLPQSRPLITTPVISGVHIPLPMASLSIPAVLCIIILFATSSLCVRSIFSLWLHLALSIQSDVLAGVLLLPWEGSNQETENV